MASFAADHGGDPRFAVLPGVLHSEPVWGNGTTVRDTRTALQHTNGPRHDGTERGLCHDSRTPLTAPIPLVPSCCNYHNLWCTLSEPEGLPLKDSL
jgi:hypothetical protein